MKNILSSFLFVFLLADCANPSLMPSERTTSSLGDYERLRERIDLVHAGMTEEELGRQLPLERLERIGYPEFGNVLPNFYDMSSYEGVRELCEAAAPETVGITDELELAKAAPKASQCYGYLLETYGSFVDRGISPEGTLAYYLGCGDWQKLHTWSIRAFIILAEGRIVNVDLLRDRPDQLDSYTYEQPGCFLGGMLKSAPENRVWRTNPWWWGPVS